jgi:ABC-type cobalamin transport system ATPase subunit
VTAGTAAVAAEQEAAQRRRYGSKMWDNKREPKVVTAQRERQAQVSVGRHRNLHPERAAQLLMLDEPTNNLDLPSSRILTQALAGYRGALIVASHDLPFLHGLRLHRWLRLDRHELLTARYGGGEYRRG